MSSSDSSPSASAGVSLWNAARDAKSESLLGVDLAAPDSAEVADLIKEARQETEQRAQAYRTGVTEKTLRRKLR